MKEQIFERFSPGTAYTENMTRLFPLLAGLLLFPVFQTEAAEKYSIIPEPEKTELEVIPEDGLGTFTVPVTVWAGEEGRNLVLYGMCAYGGQTEAVSLLLEKTEGSSGGVTPSSAAAPVWRPVRYAPAEPLEE